MKQTRYEQVADKIINLIHKGTLKEGEKIPSIRQLSKELKVSVNTVKEAYWKLENQNYIKAIPQSGFYVNQQLPVAPELAKVDPFLLDPQEVSLCRIYGAFQNKGICTPQISLGIAALNPEFWPTEKMSRFLQDTIRLHEIESYNYLMPPGYLPLRKQIARLGLTSGFDLSPDEIIITNGCHEAVYLSLMTLCPPGSTVVFESPIYFNLIQVLSQLNLKIIEVPNSKQEGIQIETLRFVLENFPVKAVFSISNFNNPLGFSMPQNKKARLVQLLSDYGIPLIEDDIYGDLSFGTRPETCKTYDQDGNVLLCSSFSKTIAPGLRVGWIAPGKYFDQILKLKTLLNISTASINQIAVAKFLQEGGYDRHLRALTKNLKNQVMAMRSCILTYFPKGTRVSHPAGGFLLWIELPKAIDTYRIYQKLLKLEILIAPGRLFSIKDRYSNCMRLNAGTWNDQVESAVKTIGKLCHQELKKSGFLNPSN